jgi:uncharacterized protein (DUF1501 family)
MTDFAPTPDTLVYVFLRGGLDALNTVVPAADPAYRAARPTLAVPAGSLLPLDGTFGLHPALRPLLPVWQDRQLAFVHAVGNPGGGRSHFEAQDALDCGVSRSGAARSGWISRHLATSGGSASPMRGLGISSTTPLSLFGAIDPVSARELEDFGLHLGPQSLQPYERTLRALYGGFDHPVTKTAAATLDAAAAVRALEPESYLPDNGAAYPDTDLGLRLKQVAIAMKRGGGVRAATVDVDDYDLHTDAGAAGGGTLAARLDDLGRSLAALRTDLGPARWASVTVVVVSEFGRRLRENGDGGTDHGYGGLMMLLGGGVRGGRVHARWPGLGRDQLVHGDLAVTTDFRDVLGEVVAQRLGNGANLATVFPGHTVRPLGLLAPLVAPPVVRAIRPRSRPGTSPSAPWPTWRRRRAG